MRRFGAEKPLCRMTLLRLTLAHPMRLVDIYCQLRTLANADGYAYSRLRD